MSIIHHISNVSQKQNWGTLHNEHPFGFVITDRRNIDTILNRYLGYPNILIDSLDVLEFECVPEIQGSRFVEAMIKNVLCGELDPTFCYSEREYISEIKLFFGGSEGIIIGIDCTGFVDRESAPHGFLKIK